MENQYSTQEPENVANSKNIQVPIIAFQNLKKEKQAKMFLDINENQKPVSADLVWDLRGQLTPDEPAGIISRIVKKLNDDGVLTKEEFTKAKKKLLN